MSDYPERPGYVQGSDTSEAAADSFSDVALSGMRADVYAFVARNGAHGATCDETEVALRMRHQTASARLRELFLGGHVIIGREQRRTRSGRMAMVYYRAKHRHG